MMQPRRLPCDLRWNVDDTKEEKGTQMLYVVSVYLETVRHKHYMKQKLLLY